MSGAANAFDVRLTQGSLRLRASARFGREWIAIAGENGAGKSTLLRALAGFAPASGLIRMGDAIWLDDAAGRCLPAAERPVGFVWPETVLLPWLDAAANIRLGRHGDKEGEAWFREVCEACEIGHLLARRPDALSSGEAQRVMLARAFYRRPALLLLDEPLSAQAPEVRARLRPRLRDLARKLGAPALMISHDAADVAMADACWRMREGILFTGPHEKDAAEEGRMTERARGGMPWG